MSASPAPANPGTPKTPPSRVIPPQTMLRRYAGPLLLASLALGGIYTYTATRAPRIPGAPKGNILRTPGVKNIEKAYENGGATATHTPAYGGSVQGGKGQRRDDTGFREGAATGTQMPKNFESEGMGEEQRPVQPTAIGKVWNNMKYGSEKGK